MTSAVLAQLVERVTFNPVVVGSIPTDGECFTAGSWFFTVYPRGSIPTEREFFTLYSRYKYMQLSLHPLRKIQTF